MSCKFALCLSQGIALDIINPEQTFRVLKLYGSHNPDLKFRVIP